MAERWWFRASLAAFAVAFLVALLGLLTEPQPWHFLVALWIMAVPFVWAVHYP